MIKLLEMAFYHLVDSEYKWAVAEGYYVDDTISIADANQFLKEIENGYDLGVYVDRENKILSMCTR